MVWLIDRTNLTFGQILVDFEHQKFTLLIISTSLYILWGDISEIFLQTELFSKNGKFFNWFWLFCCSWKSKQNFDKKFLKYLYSQSIPPYKLGPFFSKIGKCIFLEKNGPKPQNSFLGEYKYFRNLVSFFRKLTWRGPSSQNLSKKMMEAFQIDSRGALSNMTNDHMRKITE